MEKLLQERDAQLGRSGCIFKHFMHIIWVIDFLQACQPELGYVKQHKRKESPEVTNRQGNQVRPAQTCPDNDQ